MYFALKLLKITHEAKMVFFGYKIYGLKYAIATFKTSTRSKIGNFILRLEVICEFIESAILYQ